MPSSPEDSERLKKVALKAVAAMAGTALVHYFWSRDKDKVEAYVYRFRDSSEGVLVGLLQGGQDRVQQFAGRLVTEGKNRLSFILENDEGITLEGVERLEEILE